ncbi:MAG: hypothetical protein O3A00_20490, partial [Planctomycetota bacterium]|nr:hypothetical protein [Planctomycetota bacterium]
MPRSSVQATFRPHATTPAHPAFSRLSRTVRSADGARQDEPEAQASESLKTGLDRGFAQSA